MLTKTMLNFGLPAAGNLHGHHRKAGCGHTLGYGHSEPHAEGVGPWGRPLGQKSRNMNLVTAKLTVITQSLVTNTKPFRSLVIKAMLHLSHCAST